MSIDTALHRVLRTFLDEDVYLSDLEYFSFEITPEQEYRDRYEICFNVAEYITWLFMNRPNPYPLQAMNPYMKIHTARPNVPPSSWSDIPFDRDGIYKIYMLNDTEQHEFVIAVVSNYVYIMSGYGGWFGPLFRKVKADDWLDEIDQYIEYSTALKSRWNSMTEEEREAELDYSIVDYSTIFALPITVSIEVYTEFPPTLSNDIWFVEVPYKA